jgi:hypothetical protein
LRKDKGQAIVLESAIQATLVVKRWVHGKYSVSLSPRLHRAEYTTKVAVRGARLAREQIDTRDVRLEKKYRADMRAATAALDCSAEFRGDGNTLCGWGRVAYNRRFTNQARTVIQETVEIIERSCSTKGLFATGTVPNQSQEAKLALLSRSGWFVDRLLQSIRASIKPEIYYVYVWEYTKKGTPHLHLYINSRCEAALKEFAVQWRGLWFDNLKKLGSKLGVNFFSKPVSANSLESKYSYYPGWGGLQADCQPVVASAGRYLSKYLSKQSLGRCNSAVATPSRWSGAHRGKRAEARAERIRISVGGLSLDVLTRLFTSIFSSASAVTESLYSFSHPVAKRFGGFVWYLTDSQEQGFISKILESIKGQGIDFQLELGL